MARTGRLRLVSCFKGLEWVKIGPCRIQSWSSDPHCGSKSARLWIILLIRSHMVWPWLPRKFLLRALKFTTLKLSSMSCGPRIWTKWIQVFLICIWARSCTSQIRLRSGGSRHRSNQCWTLSPRARFSHQTASQLLIARLRLLEESRCSLKTPRMSQLLRQISQAIHKWTCSLLQAISA